MRKQISVNVEVKVDVAKCLQAVAFFVALFLF